MMHAGDSTAAAEPTAIGSRPRGYRDLLPFEPGHFWRNAELLPACQGSAWVPFGPARGEGENPHSPLLELPRLFRGPAVEIVVPIGRFGSGGKSSALRFSVPLCMYVH